MNEIDNKIYPKQYLLLCFFSSVTFKIIMLPQFLTQVAERQAIWTMLYLMIVEAIMFIAIYGIINKGGILALNIPKSFKKIFCILILVSNFFKLITFLTESLDYITITLFDFADWIVALIPFILAIAFISSKGLNIIGRSSQISIWFVAIAFVFSIVFMKPNLEFSNLKPVIFNSEIFQAGDMHLMWFGDFSVLLFATIAPTTKSNKIFASATFLSIIIMPVLLMIAFIGYYGGGAKYLPNVFSKIAVYNQISDILGTVDFPVVISWLMMASIKMSLIMCAIFISVRYLIKDSIWVSIIITIIIPILQMTVFKTQDFVYELATSWIRYVVTAVEFILPLIVLIVMRKYEPKHEKILSSDMARVNNQCLQDKEQFMTYHIPNDDESLLKKEKI